MVSGSTGGSKIAAFGNDSTFFFLAAFGFGYPIQICPYGYLTNVHVKNYSHTLAIY